MSEDIWKDQFIVLYIWMTFWSTCMMPFLIPKHNRNVRNIIVMMIIGALMWWIILPMEVISRTGICNSVGDKKEHSLFGEIRE